jgi:hypothetical protein
MKKYFFISILFFFIFSCSPKSNKNDQAYYDNESNQPYYDENSSEEGKSKDDVANEKLTDEYTDDADLKTTVPGDVTGEVTNVTETTETTTETTIDEDITDTSYLNTDLTDRKIIKTASLKFEVKNVERTTDIIEDLAREFEGYTSQSKLTSYLSDSELIELSKDSVLKVSEFHVVNSMIIIVPKKNFDQVLKEISKLYIYLDSRDITTEDVSTIFLRNKLKAINKLTYEKRMQNAIDDKGKKLNDIIAAEQKASNLGDKAIDDKIANYNLQDKIDYSRITIFMYQSSSVYQQNIENTNLSDYKPSFGRRIYKALKSGFEMILDLFVGLTYLWPFIVLVVLLVFGYKMFMKKVWSKRKDKKDENI